MKKYFLTGLVILLPVTLTVAIVIFIFNFLTVPFLGIVKAVFERYLLFEEGFLFLNADQVQTLFAQFLILGSLLLIVFGLGMIASWFFFNTFLKFAEQIVTQIPVVRTIYKTCHDVINRLFTSKAQAFKQVVLVPFPNPDSFSFGFITKEDLQNFKGLPDQETVAVFVPTTPNPTSGFLMMFKTSDLFYLDMRVEDAFKTIISCGVIYPDFKVISKDEAQQKFRTTP